MTPRFPRRCALITGASSGIGEAFARLLARQGFRVALAARRGDRLRELAATLPASPGFAPVVLAADLIDQNARERLWRELASRDFVPDLVINNAGASRYGEFAAAPRQAMLELVRLNCEALTDLAHGALSTMLASGAGALINVGSVLSFAAAPGMAVYGASKAFVLSLSEALDIEARPRGVRVMALCPGPVRTEFAERSGLSHARGQRLSQSAEDCAARALRDLGRGCSVSMPGVLPWGYRVMAALLPRFLTARLNAFGLAWADHAGSRESGNSRAGRD